MIEQFRAQEALFGENISDKNSFGQRTKVLVAYVGGRQGVENDIFWIPLRQRVMDGNKDILIMIRDTPYLWRRTKVKA